MRDYTPRGTNLSSVSGTYVEVYIGKYLPTQGREYRLFSLGGRGGDDKGEGMIRVRR
jgi:hypothetical protein